MEKITNQKHSKEAFTYILSKMFERASYGGFRIILILYMIDEGLKMDRYEALNILGWFIASIFFSQIIGAILGDMVLGNKRSIIIGAILQTIGVFILLIPSTVGLYTGLTIVTLGAGLYNPNIISNFGKLYLSKSKLLDSAFTLYYLAVNLGSFLGTALIGIAATRYGYNIGFTIAGIAMLFSIIPMVFSKEQNTHEIVKNEFPKNKRILTISMAVVLLGLFWGINQTASIRMFYINLEFSKLSQLNIPKSIWEYSNFFFIILISLFLVILWRYFYTNQFFKLMLGFIFGAVAFGILLFIPEIPSEKHFFLYLVSLFFLGISEVCIAPIVNSILTKYGNPKFLAILFSLVFIPTALFSFLFGMLNGQFYESYKLALIFAISAMSIISIGLIVFILWRKKNQLQPE